MKTIAIIPHYNHSATVAGVVQALHDAGLPVLVVDDGSDAAHHDVLQHLENENVRVLYLPQNGGKGSAMAAGMRQAAAQGYSHALQIDADGQHDTADIPRFLTTARAHPQALVCGKPVYGADAPKARLYGRKITNFWNALHSGSREIHDGMCGFRLYPLDAALAVINEEHIGKRMDFDTDILIRLYWRGVPLIWIDTAVRYHADGISHFRAFADNLRISRMHARLFCTMLLRRISGRWRR